MKSRFKIYKENCVYSAPFVREYKGVTMKIFDTIIEKKRLFVVYAAEYKGLRYDSAGNEQYIYPKDIYTGIYVEGHSPFRPIMSLNYIEDKEILSRISELDDLGIIYADTMENLIPKFAEVVICE